MSDPSEPASRAHARPTARETVLADPRARADRHDAETCEWCGRAVRWVRNASSAREGAKLQIVARPVVQGRWFDADRHVGLIGVDAHGDGRAVGRRASADDLAAMWLYQCHWDVCDDARRIRDRRSAELRGIWPQAPGPVARAAAEVAVDRFAAWRDRDSRNDN